MNMPDPASPGDERVVAIVGNLTRVSGLMGTRQKRYSLILTDRRVIFAELSKDKLKAVVDQARSEAKAQGKGFFGRWSAEFKAPATCHEAYWQMTPDAALTESPGNFAVDHTEIEKVKFKAGMVDEAHATPDQITIKTASDKYKLNVGGSLSAAKEAFRSAGIG